MATTPFARQPLAERTLNMEAVKTMERTQPNASSPTKPQLAQDTPSLTLLGPSQASRAKTAAGVFEKDADNASDYTHVIVCPRSIALLVGRAKCSDQDDLQSSIAEAVGGSVPVQRASLPSNARHVSRDHAVIFHTPFYGSSWAIKILGQNGLVVNGKRRRAGITLKIVPGETLLDFFGVQCMFIGDGEEHAGAVGKRSLAPRYQEAQDGRSPSKRAVDENLQTNEKANEDAITVTHKNADSIAPQKRLIANMAKRPQGAPLSPPTSSPAPRDFGVSSSPVASLGRRGNSLPESDDEEEERESSPTLDRRSGKGHNDSGVLIPGGRESEDEASQALPALSAKASKHLLEHPKQKKRELSSSGEEALSASPSVTPTPRRSAGSQRDVKRVKFQGSVTPQHSGTPARSSTAAITLESMQAIQAHYRAIVSTLASTYDLQGLLAGVIVFHRTATISATEAVRSVLAANPGLLRGEVGPEGSATVAHGQVIPGWTRDDLLARELVHAHEADAERVDTWQRKAWREKLETCLIEGECFGIIQRAGKDASGNPLECWYYYDKEHDPDAQRAANLGAFAKPMRAALKSHKPIFWRKSGYGNNNDDASTNSTAAAGSSAPSFATTASGIARSNEQQSLATESQWGSAGNALTSLLLSSHQGSAKSATTSRDAMSAAARSQPSPADVVAASTATWDETQYEENESTWDKEGDLDFDAGSRRHGRKRK